MALSIVQQIQNAAQTQRKLRTPSHPFYVEHQPWHLQPFFIAPVLPGETLKNLNITGRMITDPLKTGPMNILPWWHEHYLFYVKLRDLDAKSDIEQMLLKNTALPGGLTTAAKSQTYHAGGTIDWVEACLKVCTEEYFRREGEVWNTGGGYLNGSPLIATRAPGQDWMDSLIIDTNPGVSPVNNEFQNPEGERDPWASHAEAYERMRMVRYTDMSFEEWLATQGVGGPSTVEKDKPELIRYTRNWSYPTNVIEPTTGVPSGAAAFSVSERADKDRYFKEPGFLFGVTTARPKIYMGNQRGAAVQMLTDAYAWLSVLMQDRPETAMKEFVGPTAPTGPLSGQTSNYWVDVEDLLRYGDQFIGSTTGLPAEFKPALPTAATEPRWVTQVMIDALFATAGTNKIRYDGRVDISILARPSVVHDDT